MASRTAFTGPGHVLGGAPPGGTPPITGTAHLRAQGTSTAQPTPQRWTFHFPSISCPRLPPLSQQTYRDVQLGLFVATLGSIILASIPPLSFVGGLTMRSISCLSQLIFGYQQLPKETTLLGKASIVAQIACGVLGLAALAALSPALMIASLVMDVVYRAIEMKKSYDAKDWGTFAFHATFLVIDVLGIGALASGSWQLLLAASVCNLLAIAIFMTIQFVKWQRGEGAFVPYETLGIGLMSAMSSLTLPQIFTKK